jgi:hypothetical protein
VSSGVWSTMVALLGGGILVASSPLPSLSLVVSVSSFFFFHCEMFLLVLRITKVR